MSENKMGKYFKYAIGEIILVMVGILLALQVNNWNEVRKSKTAERLLLISLKEDFKIRNDELKEFKLVRTSILKNIEQLVYMINDPTKRLPEASMDSITVTLQNAVSFNNQFKMLDLLFNTGKINEISNARLKQLLIQWPQQVEEMMEEQEARDKLNINYLTPLVYKHLSNRQLLSSIDFRSYNLKNNLPITKQSDYDGFLADPIFENYLSTSEILHKVNGIDSDKLINMSEEIIKLLDEEVKLLE